MLTAKLKIYPDSVDYNACMWARTAKNYEE